MTTLDSLRLYLSDFTLQAVLEETSRWWSSKATCFESLLQSLKIPESLQQAGVLDEVLPLPDTS